jgi:hypothetical protein
MGLSTSVSQQERVLIVESPSLVDINTGARHGEHLDKLLTMLCVESIYRPFSTAERLGAVLEGEAKAATCIHVCGHRRDEGFGLTDQTLLPWEVFARLVLACASHRIVVHGKDEQPFRP